MSDSKALTTPVPEVARGHRRLLDSQTEAPTQETGTLPRIPTENGVVPR